MTFMELCGYVAVGIIFFTTIGFVLGNVVDMYVELNERRDL